jgi:hypothetical protein
MFFKNNRVYRSNIPLLYCQFYRENANRHYEVREKKAEFDSMRAESDPICDPQLKAVL